VNGVLTGVICFFAVSHKALSGKALQIADAFALAFFTIIGTQKGIAMNFHPVVTVFLGVVTGVAGGILRDVLLRELPMVFRPEIHLYATASLIGAGTLVLVRQAGVDEKLAAGIAVAVALVLRLAAIRWKISLPVLESRD